MAYSEIKDDLPAIPGSQKNKIGVLPIIAFAILSLISNPFVYDEKNSGRYLLKVIKAADPTLFTNDPVVDSLQRFHSAFYDLLAWLFNITSAPPEMVAPVVHGLYIAGEVLLFCLLYKVATAIIPDIRYFLLIALWATFTVSVPVGGIGLFEPILRHSEVAFLLCLIALYCLSVKKFYVLFWFSLAVALLVHSIMTIQLLLVIAPAYLFWHWHNTERHTPHVIGMIIFGLTFMLYFILMAPPTMSPEEGALFLNSKGDMQHISPFNQSPVGWFTLLMVAGVSLGIGWIFDRQEFHSRQMSLIIIWGTVVGLGLSLLAISVSSVRLAQFQPMRIFLWVWLLATWLWLLQTYKQLRSGSLLGVLMSGVVFLFMLQSLYALLLVSLIVLYLCLHVYGIYSRKALPVDKWARCGLIGFTCLIALGLAVGHGFNLASYFLRSLFPLPVMMLCLLLIYRPWLSPSVRQGLWLALFIIVITGAHSYWQGRQPFNSDWHAVQQWSREHTGVTERFLTTPGIGTNFRTGAFRTTVSEPMSALAWVDPQTNAQLSSFVAEVYKAQSSEGWDLIQLINLAQRVNASYVVVPGTTAHSFPPVFQTETILIFATKDHP